MIDIKDIRFYNKNNSLVSEKNLTGSIGQYKKVEVDIYIHWELLNFDCTFFGNQIVCNDASKSWITAGFKVGDTIVVENDGSDTSNDGTYLVSGISASILSVESTDSSSGPITFTTLIGVFPSVYGTTPVTDIDYYFGLCKNGDPKTYTSLIDGETQKFRSTGLDASVSTPVALTANTLNKSWLSGSTAEQALTVIEGTGIGTSGVSTGYEQCFTITHVFHIEPAVLDGWEDSSENLDVTLVDWFNGSNALYYTPRVVAGFAPSSIDHTTDEGNISAFFMYGDNGFYDEYRNGGAPKYSLTSISYVNGSTATTELASNTVTSVEIVIESLVSFSSHSHFDLYVYELPDTSAEYSNNTDDVWTNFDVSNINLDSIDAGPNSDNKILTATSTYTTTTATINFTYHGMSSEKRYIIFVVVSNVSADMDEQAVLCDYSRLENFIKTSDIFTSNQGVLINEHSSNDLNRAYSDYKGWVEDGLLVTHNFLVKKLAGISEEFDCELTALSVNISCENQTDSTRNFVLEEVNYTIPESSTRGFILATGDPKNDKTLTVGAGDADNNEFTLEFATKLRFESTVTLPTADADFPTPTMNWSQYDQDPDWFIYLNIVKTVSLVGNGAESTDASIEETYTETIKTRIRIKDYDEYDGCEKTGTVFTYHPASGTDLGGKILKTGNTKVVAKFYGESLFPCVYAQTGEDCEFTELSSGSGSYSNEEGVLVDCPEYYGILEILPLNGTEFDIDQISTIVEPSASTAWIGPMPTNKAKITMYPYATPPRIEVEATLDYTLLSTTIPTYTLSARLGRSAETICRASIMAAFGFESTTLVNDSLTGFTTDEILVFNTGKELTVQNKASLSGDTITFSPAVGRYVKVCCAVDKVSGTTSQPGGEFQDNSLIGLTDLDSFIVFFEGNGNELTTSLSLTFDSGTGTIGGLPPNVDIMVSLHEAFISDNIPTSTTTYTNALFSGYGPADVMVFVGGQEQTSKGITIIGTTISFPTAVSGDIKIIKVYQ